MTIQPSSADTDEPMNVTEPIRCGLARAAAGYESGIELEDIAALIDAYDRLALAQGVQELQELENDAFRGGLSAEAFAATQGGDKGEAVAWQAREKAKGPDWFSEHCDIPHLNPKYEYRPLYAAPLPASNAQRPTHSQLSELDDASNACLELAAKHGYATGHGDTVGDMIREFSSQIPNVAYAAWLPIASARREWLSPILAWNSRQPTWPPVVVRWNKDGNEEIDGEPHWCDAATSSGDALYFNQNFFDLWMPCPSTSIPSTQERTP